VLGFHGQTILHRPGRPGDAAPGRTWQIGDAAALAAATGCSVVHDFRSADVAAGGQGAPLVPVAHAALAEALPRPLAVLNLGGVGNVTWLGADGRLLAFDTGPANGPLDDWARRSAGCDYDHDGQLALAGQVDGAVLGRLMKHPFLDLPPPKSLDRLDFEAALREAGAEALSPQDGAATLVAFAAVCVAAASRHFPEPPLQWIVAGGGRRNPAMMRALAGALAEPVRPVEVVGWNGDALEAQCFAVLAARCLRGLPLTYPGTTGVGVPLPGGRVANAR
jgi:anhydro-N-acetylmuramic acid kinase